MLPCGTFGDQAFAHGFLGLLPDVLRQFSDLAALVGLHEILADRRLDALDLAFGDRVHEAVLRLRFRGHFAFHLFAAEDNGLVVWRRSFSHAARLSLKNWPASLD